MTTFQPLIPGHGGPTEEIDMYDDEELEPGDGTSRRSLLFGGLAVAAGGFAATLLAGVEAADAKALSDSRKRTYGPVSIISDSSVLYNMPNLASKLKAANIGPFVIDCRPSRTLAKSHPGVSTALSYIKSTRVKPAVVVALGGGDTGLWNHTGTEIRSGMSQVIAALGNRQIGLSTQYSPRAAKPKTKASMDAFNAACFAAAAANSNVFVGDWASTVKQHPEWFSKDQAHYVGAGASARNTFVANMALKACKRL